MHPNDLARLVIAAATATVLALALRPGTAKGEQAVSTSTETFTCPQAYPGKDRPPARLTNGAMAWGEDRAGVFAGDYSKSAANGFDEAFPIMAYEQAWLICSYGGKKRHKGKFQDGREWGQYMEWSPIESWVKLPPKVHGCTLHVRGIKAGGRSAGTWSVNATCRK